jgi:NAD(P)-dependent dehydrogenase (short-subunit alcohol dehydrogenase family)
MAQHLQDRVCLITGGAGGIGSQLSTVFAEQGAKVIVADTGADVEGRMGVDPTKVDAVVQRIRDAGGEAIGSVGDIADMDYAESAVELALNTYGDLDVVVCAHGILRERMIFNMAEDEWDSVVRTHLKGCFAPTKYAAIHWRTNREKGQRRLIYFTSDAGIRGSAGQPNYSAAHAGKLGLMRSNVMGLDRYGATTNCIAPGASTRMTDRGRGVSPSGPSPSEAAAGTARDPKNVVPICVWLASTESDACNGRVFSATGHRIALFSEPVQERFMTFAATRPDVDGLFDLWPHTLAEGGYPRNQMRPGGRRSEASATSQG